MSTEVELQHQLQLKDEYIARIRKELEFKDLKIKELTSQLDKYQSVFSPPKRRVRALGISAEPNQLKYISQSTEIDSEPYPKGLETKNLIRRAILENDFMKNLDISQVNEIIEYMQPEECNAGDIIIREGDYGKQVFVMEDGTVNVSRGGLRKHDLSGAFVFGELAILYNCTRTATVTALTKCKLWAIERQLFQSIMVKASFIKRQEHLNFLRSVPTFNDLLDDRLNEIADACDEVHFTNSEYIIRQGTPGDKFYVIINGQVKVTKHSNKLSQDASGDSNTVEEQLLRFMGRGEWFGEKALKNDEVRTASIMAISDEGVDCLVLDRDSYSLLIANLNGFKREYPDELQLTPRKTTEFDKIELKDISVIATLGVGGFGRVELIRLGSDSSKTYALKQMKKHHIVETRQQEHVLNEKNILMVTDCDFIVRLYRTFKDDKYLYMMLEACLGGEMWSILRDRGSFTDETARFYIACVLEALNYLHSRFIIYRDLKPENLLLDEFGYCKITDFGFAKNIFNGRKTWTFCGTPEYVAPEIILNKGHDITADYWSLGILMFELLTGSPPFTAFDPMQTYNIILKGIDTLDFPRKVSRNAQNLIKAFCRDVPSERIGCGRNGINDVMKHAWFDSFNFDDLRERKIQPPIIPKVSSPTDMSNFDDYPPDADTPLDDLSGWDHDF